MYNYDQFMIPPEKYDKRGPLFSGRKANLLCIKMINSDQYFLAGAKIMAKDIDNATALVEEALSKFDKSLSRLLSAQKQISEEAKKITGNIRGSTHKLSDGLSKIESRANFDRLERYVELLERADKAMLSLAELEESGKLEKIASAIR